MPLQYLQFRPGVSRESTDLANSGGWYACDKIRFRSGMPEKIGGWAPATSATFLGDCKHIVEWVTLSGYYLLGLGTNLKYYIYNENNLKIKSNLVFKFLPKTIISTSHAFCCLGLEGIIKLK